MISGTSIPIWFIVYEVVGGCLSVALLLHRSRRFRELIEQWANENGYIIVAQKLRLDAPSEWAKRNTFANHRVVVRDAAGQTRSGWVRLEGWFWVLKIEVKWDKHARHASWQN